MGWVHYDETGLLVIEEGEELKQVPEGILDQLIASVMRGDFGLDTDEDTKRRRTRTVPVRVKKEAEISSEKEQNAPAENPSEEQPAKKPRKVFKFPKPAEPGEDDGGELEAKLAARAYKDAEIEAEELAKKEIEEEERKARAVRSLTKSKKLLFRRLLIHHNKKKEKSNKNSNKNSKNKKNNNNNRKNRNQKEN